MPESFLKELFDLCDRHHVTCISEGQTLLIQRSAIVLQVIVPLESQKAQAET